jgi:N-acetyl-anhydromuramyl-L-alanine amidase AmpD
MRGIDLIVVHCSDSDNPAHDDVSVINQWHLERGFSGVGYHYFIKNNGDIQKGRPDEKIGAHVKGCNKSSLGVCLHGRKRFTKEQFKSLQTLLVKLIIEYGLTSTSVKEHNKLDKTKTCPNFIINEELRALQGE